MEINLFGGYGERTMVQYEGKTVISTTSSVDTERLQRGWGLIYSKYCKGTEKPF